MEIPHPPCALTASGLECIRNDELIFQGVEVQVRGGDILQVDGPNGSGKSSLLRILCGLLQPSEGAVQWCGKDIQTHYPDFLTDLVYVGHQGGVTAELTPVENLRVSMALGVPRAGADPAAALAAVQLRGLELVSTRHLSAGQRQRVALARLLLREARVWVLDEPFNALDQQGKAMIERFIGEHTDRGGITILATHQPVDVPGHRLSRLGLGG